MLKKRKARNFKNIVGQNLDYSKFHFGPVKVCIPQKIWGGKASYLSINEKKA